MAKRPTELKEHVPFPGVPSAEDIAVALSGLVPSAESLVPSVIKGSPGQVPVPARTPAGTGFMQLGPVLGSFRGAGATGTWPAATTHVPGIPDPTGFELDPLGRGAAFSTGFTGALPRLPVETPPVVAAAPAEIAIPSVADLSPVAVPGVSPMGTRSIEELSSIASMLAPQVEAGPLTREQLIGGDVFGLTPEQVQNVTTTRMNQLATKATTDKQALDFLRTSTGVVQAEGLVKDKIREEGDIARTKFTAETQAEQSALSANRKIELEKWKAKTDLTNRLLVSKAEAAAEAATTPSFVDQWKEQKAQGYLELYQTNPQAALGLARLIEPEDIRQALEADKLLPADSALKMDESTHRIYSQILSQGVVPEGGE